MPKTALVTIDLQQALASRQGAPHTLPAIIARTAELATAFRDHSLPVVRVVDVRADATHVPELIDARDVVIEKQSWSAFDSSDIDTRLKDLGVERVVLAGIATSIGVEGTARSAHAHGYELVIATDAITDLDAAGHERSMTRILPRLGTLQSATEIIASLAADD